VKATDGSNQDVGARYYRAELSSQQESCFLPPIDVMCIVDVVLQTLVEGWCFVESLQMCTCRKVRCADLLRCVMGSRGDLNPCLHQQTLVPAAGLLQDVDACCPIARASIWPLSCPFPSSFDLEDACPVLLLLSRGVDGSIGQSMCMSHSLFVCHVGCLRTGSHLKRTLAPTRQNGTMCWGAYHMCVRCAA